MTEIKDIALVCPADCDIESGLLTSNGSSQLNAVATELRTDARFIDSLVLHARGLAAHAITAAILGEKLEEDGYVVLESSMVNTLNDSPMVWAGALRGYLEAAIIGAPPIDPPIEHEGKVVAVVCPEAIAAITGITRVAEITPDSVYYPDLK